MKRLVAIACLLCFVALHAQVFDLRTPEERARDERNAKLKKEKLSRRIDYAQVTDALRATIKDHPIEDGVELSDAKIDQIWDWRLQEPYADPTSGDWTVGIEKNRWGRVTALHFSLFYDQKTKKLDAGSPTYVVLDFKAHRMRGKVVVQFDKISHDEVVILMPFGMSP